MAAFFSTLFVKHSVSHGVEGKNTLADDCLLINYTGTIPFTTTLPPNTEVCYYSDKFPGFVVNGTTTMGVNSGERNKYSFAATHSRVYFYEYSAVGKNLSFYPLILGPRDINVANISSTTLITEFPFNGQLSTDANGNAQAFIVLGKDLQITLPHTEGSVVMNLEQDPSFNVESPYRATSNYVIVLYNQEGTYDISIEGNQLDKTPAVTQQLQADQIYAEDEGLSITYIIVIVVVVVFVVVIIIAIILCLCCFKKDPEEEQKGSKTAKK